MLLMKLLFAVLIIVCAVFYILYIWDFSLVLLIVISALPIIMFVILLDVKRKTSVKFAVKSRIIAKNEEFNIQLCVENKSIFPIGKAEAFIEYYNIFNKCVNRIELNFPIQPRNIQRVTFRLSSKFCGMVNIRCAHINIYDPMKIFRMKIGRNITEDIIVIPEGQEINGIVVDNSCVESEGNVFSESRSGDDPSEVFDLREYSPGDRLNRIHWKLSSKKDDFIVKEYSCPVDSPAVIFLDLCCSETSELRLPLYDTLIELCTSLSRLFIENERIHSIIYYNGTEKSFVKRDISSIGNLSAVIAEMIAAFNDNSEADDPSVYLSEPQERSLTSFTFITSAANDAVLTTIDDCIDAEIKNAAIAVKTPDEELNGRFPTVNIIPVAVGRISSSVRAIEI